MKKQFSCGIFLCLCGGKFHDLFSVYESTADNASVDTIQQVLSRQLIYKCTRISTIFKI